MFEKYKVRKNKSIEQAMQIQKDNSLKCLIVVDFKDKFLGTISDGDIRNAILKKIKLSEKIEKIFNKSPYFYYENKYDLKKIKKNLNDQSYPYVPIINKNRKIINIIDLNFFGKKEEVKKINLPVVIMAGGYGTRLRPSTNILPKPLIPLQGKAIIEHIIDEFKPYNIKKYYISLNYKSILVKAFFSELKKSVNVNFLNEKKPLGTAGSLNFLLKKKINEFIVINCDTIIKTDFNKLLKFHKFSKNDISVVGAINNLEIPYGVCEIGKNRILKKIDEKPKFSFLASVGCYIINKKALRIIPKNKYLDFNELITKAIKKKLKVGVYPIDRSEWIDVGSFEYINQLNNLS
jgi:dTDP-glucose pyrophosphorylase